MPLLDDDMLREMEQLVERLEPTLRAMAIVVARSTYEYYKECQAVGWSDEKAFELTKAFVFAMKSAQ